MHCEGEVLISGLSCWRLPLYVLWLCRNFPSQALLWSLQVPLVLETLLAPVSWAVAGVQVPPVLFGLIVDGKVCLLLISTFSIQHRVVYVYKYKLFAIIILYVNCRCESFNSLVRSQNILK